VLRTMHEPFSATGVRGLQSRGPSSKLVIRILKSLATRYCCGVSSITGLATTQPVRPNVEDASVSTSVEGLDFASWPDPRPWSRYTTLVITSAVISERACCQRHGITRRAYIGRSHPYSMLRI
jgi:hypothetical protein